MLHRLVSLVFIYFLFLQALCVHAHPVGSRTKSFKNINATTLRTVHTTMTGDGPVTETCDITLTPITDTSGKPAVEEVRKCFLTFEDDDDEEGPGVTTVPSVSGTLTSQIPQISTTSSSTAVPTSTESPTPSSTTAQSPTPTGSTTSIPVSSDKATVSAPTPTSSSQSTESPSSTGTATPTESSSVPVTSAISTGIPSPSNDPNTSAPSPTPSTTGPPSPAPPTESSATASPTSTSDATGTTAAQSSGTSAADSTPSSTAAFQLPGKKLSVLPIGLGVFAGISVIALIVVGLVTYERTKYRKAFRQRKLAESGATMGYGGMAQRP